MTRNRLLTIIFDTDFYKRPHTRMLIKQFGHAGPSIFLAAIAFAAYENDDAVLEDSAIPYLSVEIDTPEDLIKGVLEFCVVTTKMLKRGIDCYISDRLAVDLQNMRVKQSNYKSAALLREQHKLTKIVQDSGRILDNPDRIVQVRKEQEEELEQESRTGKGTRKGTRTGRADLTFPTILNTDACRLEWQRWLTHKASLRSSYKSLDSQEAQLRRCAKMLETPERFLAAVEFSIAQNYAGIFEEAANRNGSSPRERKTFAQIQFEKTMKFLNSNEEEPK